MALIYVCSLAANTITITMACMVILLLLLPAFVLLAFLFSLSC